MSISLEVKDITAGYGDVTVLRGVSFVAPAPGITAVIGSNGAGKTTLLRTLSGLVPTSSGSFSLGIDILSGQAPDKIVRSGLAHVPEGRRLFAGMTVEDNLLMGAFSREASRSDLKNDLAAVYELFPKLAERRSQDAVSMSGGEQQMCAIGRGLMAKPRMMVIDELSLGLAPVAVDLLVDALRRLAKSGLGLLVVEQDVAVALELSDTAVVLDRGQVTRTGASKDIAADPAVRAAYLGDC